MVAARADRQMEEMMSQPTELDIAIQWLKEARACGIWLIRGAEAAVVGYTTGENDDPANLHLEPPNGIILIATFPGDAGPDGVEFVD